MLNLLKNSEYAKEDDRKANEITEVRNRQEDLHNENIKLEQERKTMEMSAANFFLFQTKSKSLKETAELNVENHPSN